MSITIVSAVNNEEILKNCLLRSPDLQSVADILIQTGFASAALAYNSGILKAKDDVIVVVHQDVYLPEGWIRRVETILEELAIQDPNWGVLGVWGVGYDGMPKGCIYWTGLERMAGNFFEGGSEVETLDECLLIIRKSSGLCFDESLAGFHMYGADICLEARRRGMKCYAVSAFCIHNTNEYKLLPREFWRACLYIRQKWKSQLPIKTTCIEITRYCWPMLQWNIVHGINLALGRKKAPKRVSDPSSLYRSSIFR